MMEKNQRPEAHHECCRQRAYCRSPEGQMDQGEEDRITATTFEGMGRSVAFPSRIEEYSRQQTRRVLRTSPPW
jgi:hypothetical protein